MLKGTTQHRLQLVTAEKGGILSVTQNCIMWHVLEALGMVYDWGNKYWTCSHEESRLQEDKSSRLEV